jgi:toxin ParE1/3/4
MKRVRFLAAADGEMLDAAARYEAQQENLGRQYLLAVREAVNRLQVMSLAYPIVDGLYRSTPDEHVVVAVMHLRRDPDYWKSRVAE